MFEIATSAFNWTPETFWNSTYLEYTHALVGYMRFNKQGYWADETTRAPATNQELLDTMNRMKEEFPDEETNRLAKELRKKRKRGSAN